ncbi:hypothetical protein BY996DRAFT_4573046, partial [Phakopsora pachyrhizi]
GIYRIVEWSDLMSAHMVPGELIIRGISDVSKPKGRELSLLEEMSSKENLTKGDYTVVTVSMAWRFFLIYFY